MRFFVDISYKGTPFHGWQKQPNAMTAQEIVEEKLSTALRTKTGVVGAGRTDTGVHARQFVFHFDFEGKLDSDKLMYKLNRLLPSEIAVNRLFRVKSDAHARFDALFRVYKYYVSVEKVPFAADYSSHIKRKIDMEKMNQACQSLLAHRNFQCFSKVKTDVKTYNCKIDEAFWRREGNQLVFTIKADRFLRNMVRAIVGTLLEIGIGKRPLSDLERIIKSRDRRQAGKSVAAKGLFLDQIAYPKSIIDY